MTVAGGDAGAFFGALLEGVPDDLWSLVWTLPHKRSTWVPTSMGVDAFVDVATGAAAGGDVYAAVAFARSHGSSSQRITSAEAAGIAGLWADIDIADPDIHKKWNLPGTEADAFDLLAASGVEPTMIVHSGHGLQAWWLWDEFWAFTTAEDRSEAAGLAQAWNTTLRVRASERGWVVDSTYDLARVMRVPGTFNRKRAPHVPVRLLSADGPRYSPSDFDGFLVDEAILGSLGLSATTTYVVDRDLTLDSGAQPPFDKFQALAGAEPLFQKSWDRARTTRDLPDQSASSYDMSLASFAASAGWSDQEIVDLLVASRRHHRDDLKLRPDYYRRTIARAHEGMSRARGAEVLADVSDDLREARAEGDDEREREARRDVLGSISQQFGIEILGVVRYDSTPPSYRLVIPTGGVALGSAEDMLSQHRMRAAIVAETGHLIDRFKAAEWDRILRVVFQAAETQDVGMESTEDGQVYSWLADYLQSRRPVESLEEASVSSHPYMDSGTVHIFASALRSWLWLSRGDRVSAKDVGRMLRTFGCRPVIVAVPSEDGSPVDRTVWAVPPRSEWKT